MFLATLREHRHQKLGEHLCRLSIEVGRKFRNGSVASMTVEDLGPTYEMIKPRNSITTYPKICQAIWTAPASQKIGKVLGFIVHLTVPFTEFKFNGKSYSERLEDDAAFCEVAAVPLYI